MNDPNPMIKPASSEAPSLPAVRTWITKPSQYRRMLRLRQAYLIMRDLPLPPDMELDLSSIHNRRLLSLLYLSTLMAGALLFTKSLSFWAFFGYIILMPYLVTLTFKACTTSTFKYWKKRQLLLWEEHPEYAEHLLSKHCELESSPTREKTLFKTYLKYVGLTTFSMSVLFFLFYSLNLTPAKDLISLLKITLFMSLELSVLLGILYMMQQPARRQVRQVLRATRPELFTEEHLTGALSLDDEEESKKGALSPHLLTTDLDPSQAGHNLTSPAGFFASTRAHMLRTTPTPGT